MIRLTRISAAMFWSTHITGQLAADGPAGGAFHSVQLQDRIAFCLGDQRLEASLSVWSHNSFHAVHGLFSQCFKCKCIVAGEEYCMWLHFEMVKNCTAVVSHMYEAPPGVPSV